MAKDKKNPALDKARSLAKARTQGWSRMRMKRLQKLQKELFPEEQRKKKKKITTQERPAAYDADADVSATDNDGFLRMYVLFNIIYCCPISLQYNVNCLRMHTFEYNNLYMVHIFCAHLLQYLTMLHNQNCSSKHSNQQKGNQSHQLLVSSHIFQLLVTPTCLQVRMRRLMRNCRSTKT